MLHDHEVGLSALFLLAFLSVLQAQADDHDYQRHIEQDKDNQLVCDHFSALIVFIIPRLQPFRPCSEKLLRHCSCLLRRECAEIFFRFHLL